ncbi:hypothetical protein MLD38_038531 [Melastoma candidum]|uniref:Uncharacterized protein n=1 Tax=Melastoma candidum TaxID=119954 RepID=A0ACB9KZ67_9MYRT|nr:hypothetical protein MLD38_038531 [Melastoma candidum]
MADRVKKLKVNLRVNGIGLNNHLFPIILSVLLLLAVKACFYKRSSSRFSNMKLPPGPMQLLVIGNLHQLVGAPFHVVLHELSKSYGPICHLKLGQVSFVSVTSSEGAKEVLKAQELRFAQREKLPIMEMTSFDHNGITFSPYGEYWKKVRKICMMEILDTSGIGQQHFKSLRELEISALVESVRCTSQLPFNVSEMIFACANSIISKASFGSQCKRPDEYRLAIKEQFCLAGQFSFPMVFPSLQFLYHLDGTKAKMVRLHAVYNDILGSIITEIRIRAKSGDHSSSHEENLVDVLLRLQESPEKTGISLTDNMIKDIINDMIGGGTDTLPTAVECGLSEMLKNPDVMEKAQAELRDALKGKAILEETDLEKISYLKLIIKETFRMHPAATVYERVAREDCVVHGYDIPKDARVVINPWSLRRDPNYWENQRNSIPRDSRDLPLTWLGTISSFSCSVRGRGRVPQKGSRS